LGLLPVLLLEDMCEGNEQSLPGVAASLPRCMHTLTSVAKYCDTLNAAACNS
jgi:hypothetical protein